jgi:uncharacterized membrane protein YfcA
MPRPIPRHQTVTGLSLVTIALLFPLFIFTQSPWQYELVDFVVKPILFFAIPTFIVGIATLKYNTSEWTMQFLPILLVLFGIVMLYLQKEWPRQGFPTSWEDSYGTLLIIEVILTGLFLPLWLTFIIVFLQKKRTRK